MSLWEATLDVFAEVKSFIVLQAVSEQQAAEALFLDVGMLEKQRLMKQTRSRKH